ALPGIVPGRDDRPAGCLLAPRCARVQPRCQSERPALSFSMSQGVRCFYPVAAWEAGTEPAPAGLPSG
ncbi:MAG: hypothetical protein LH480_11405, partial [Rubrivivax sp.]|nr:hypothetical protein [Rubrivivax sp.]